MTLVSSTTLIASAREAGTGIGAFNVIHLETAEALAKAAERSGLPLILQISQNCANYHGGLEPLALATLAIARKSSAQLAVHLDHADDVALVHEAISLGFGSVMFDAATLPYDKNVEETASIVTYAHARGVHVEAELGAVGGKDGAHAPGVRTDPAEAAAFVRETGVDSLAVAVGSSHAMTERTAQLDLDLIARLRASVDVPLVLHGSSGIADDNIVRAIGAGMTKINVSTQLNKVFTQELRKTLAEQPNMVDSRKYLHPAQEALSVEAARLAFIFALESSTNGHQ